MYKRQVVSVRETGESEFADGHRGVQAASVSEVAGGQGDVQADVYKRQYILCKKLKDFHKLIMGQLSDVSIHMGSPA